MSRKSRMACHGCGQTSRPALRIALVRWAPTLVSYRPSRTLWPFSSVSSKSGFCRKSPSSLKKYSSSPASSRACSSTGRSSVNSGTVRVGFLLRSVPEWAVSFSRSSIRGSSSSNDTSAHRRIRASPIRQPVHLTTFSNSLNSNVSGSFRRCAIVSGVTSFS